jgi:hypothetical protein
MPPLFVRLITPLRVERRALHEALVPHEPLETTISKQTLRAAARLRKPVAHSMSLEDQALDQQAELASLELLAEDLANSLDSTI